MNPYPRFGGRPDGFFEYHYGGPGAIGWTVFALQLLLVLGVAWLVVSALVGRTTRRPAVPAGTPSAGPLEVLHLRYARGEIGRDEYLQARGDLGGAPASSSEQPTQS